MRKGEYLQMVTKNNYYVLFEPPLAQMLSLTLY